MWGSAEVQCCRTQWWWKGYLRKSLLRSVPETFHQQSRFLSIKQQPPWLLFYLSSINIFICLKTSSSCTLILHSISYEWMMNCSFTSFRHKTSYYICCFGRSFIFIYITSSIKNSKILILYRNWDWNNHW